MEAISFVVGGLFRLAPELFKLWDAQKQRQHEKDMFDLQLKADQLRATLQMQTIEKQGEINQQLAELNAMITGLQAQAQAKPTLTGIKWVDAIIAFFDLLNTSVRPVLTYWYCVIGYGAYKAATYFIILSAGRDWKEAISLLWTPNDFAVMMSIIGFWFVDRALRNRAK